MIMQLRGGSQKLVEESKVQGNKQGSQVIVVGEEMKVGNRLCRQDSHKINDDIDDVDF